MRIAVVLAVALPLTAVDLVLKATRETPAWAYHERSLGWLVACCFLLAALVLLTRVPSQFVPPAAGVLAGGVLGNTLSAAWNGLLVPNPLVVTGDDAVIAFNLADLWVVVGVAALVTSIGTWLVRNRHALSEPTPLRRRR